MGPALQKTVLRIEPRGRIDRPASLLYEEMAKRFLAAGAVLCCVLFGGAANAALVRTGNLVLKADGDFAPHKLPRSQFVPISFKGYAELKAVDGGIPAALQQLVVDFDRDGKMNTAGLPVCQPESLQEATPEEARARCKSAVVGSGNASALVEQEGGAPILASSPITFFNGPRLEGKPTVILHARTTEPAVQNFVITIPIETRRGLFRHRATIDVPPIAAGRGALVRLEASIGRRWRTGGRERSYVVARCGDGIFRTHGRFTFADGLVVDGSVEKACTVR